MRSYKFDHNEETSEDEPENWISHLKDLDWKANLRALEIELKSPYNEGWWDSRTPQVTVEWPTMRKWAAQTLKNCLGSNRKRKNLSKVEQAEFLKLFQQCPEDNLKWLMFIEPTSSLVENIETIKEDQEKQRVDDSMQGNKIMLGGGNEADSFADEIWSVSAGNVDPFVPMTRGGDLDELEPIGESAFDWEPPELKSLDWRANMESLSMTMKLPLNEKWTATNALYVKDPALRRWSSDTMIDCIEERQCLTATQRRDFLRLFEKISRTYLRSFGFLNPVSVVGNMEEQDVDDSRSSGGESEDDSESSVYL